MLRQCVYLVGGRGTRLGTLTGDTPKPLLEVGGRPFLDYLIEDVTRFGIDRVLLLAGYRGDEVATRYDGTGRFRAEIRCRVEEAPSGTAGALVHARDLLDDEFLLCNGDSYFDINVLDLATLPVESDWVGKIAARRTPATGRSGVVEFAGLRITGFAERGSGGPGLINGGIYVLKKAILDRIEAVPSSIEGDIFPVLAGQGLLYGKPYDGFFIDIGIPEDLDRAQDAVPAQRRRAAAFLDRDGVLNHDTGYVHKRADFTWIDGARDAVKHLNDLGYFVFVVTNQAGVARGYFEEDDIHALHRDMLGELRLTGAHIDQFYHCPHHPDGVRAPYRRVCGCRKPGPGMIEAALAGWPVDASRSFLIGDKDIDLVAARAAGIPGYLFEGGNLLERVKDIVAAA